MPAIKTPTLLDRREEGRKLLETMGDAIEDAYQAQKKHLDQMWKLHEAEFGSDHSPYVDEGSFTYAGKKRLHELFGGGKTNREIAKFFGVTDSAIAYHRNKLSQ